MRIDTGRLFGPIPPLAAQVTRLGWTYMVWIIKIYIYPFSAPKFENLHYCLWSLRTAITENLT